MWGAVPPAVSVDWSKKVTSGHRLRNGPQFLAPSEELTFKDPDNVLVQLQDVSY
jgi:hypothetical protein